MHLISLVARIIVLLGLLLPGSVPANPNGEPVQTAETPPPRPETPVMATTVPGSGEADLILMLDVDVPWIVAKVAPQADARLFHIDCDPLKAGMGFWHFPAERTWQADSLAALEQLLALPSTGDETGRAERRAWIEDAKRRLALPDMPLPADGAINFQQLSEAIAKLVNEKTVVVFEEPTATDRVLHTLRMSRPGSYYANGGSGLGWSINAAIGLKLADPQAEVITLVGDGSSAANAGTGDVGEIT